MTNSSTQKRVDFDLVLFQIIPNHNNAATDGDSVQTIDTASTANSTGFSDHWFTTAEINKWRKVNVEELRKFKKSGSTYHDTPDFSPRGYEYVTMNYSRVAVRNKHAQRVVKFQRIAKSSAKLAQYASIDTKRSGSLDRALNLAVNDENEALMIHHPHLYQQENCPPSKLLYPSLSSSTKTSSSAKATGQGDTAKTHRKPLFHKQMMKLVQ